MSHSIVSRTVECLDKDLYAIPRGVPIFQSARNPHEARAGCDASGNIFLGISLSPFYSRRSAQAVAVDGVVEARIKCVSANPADKDCGLYPIGTPVFTVTRRAKVRNAVTVDIIENIEGCAKDSLVVYSNFTDNNNRRTDDRAAAALAAHTLCVGIIIQMTSPATALVKLQPATRGYLSTQVAFGLQDGSTSTNAQLATNSAPAQGTAANIIESARMILQLYIPDWLKVLTNVASPQQAIEDALDLSGLKLGPEVAAALFDPDSQHYAAAHDGTPYTQANALDWIANTVNGAGNQYNANIGRVKSALQAVNKAAASRKAKRSATAQGGKRGNSSKVANRPS